MTYQGDDKARLRRQATREAIDLAMQSRWQEAVAVNRSIVESFPTDMDAYNRLGRALTELGEFAEAREAYGRALELDPQNAIARKNLSRLSLLRVKRQATNAGHRQIAPHLFIEERGKAGIVSLDNPAPREVLARMLAGDQVELRVKGARLVVEDRQGTYLGQVETPHASRLVKLIQGGNKYSAAIASLDGGGVKVAIKEVYQHPSQAGRLSFSLKKTEGFRPYIRSSLLRHEAEDDLLTLDDEGEYISEVEESEEAPAEEPQQDEGTAFGDR